MSNILSCVRTGWLRVACICMVLRWSTSYKPRDIGTLLHGWTLLRPSIPRRASRQRTSTLRIVSSTNGPRVRDGP
ncbi:hypothetical protein PHLGIDRAFT_173174 [Phlebiopsis gigantea 11061_1 CR5-6]|uniref:Secreted protein n=1 Tax=Phlebiopsis gigantea (strain 11061_1 CR5-6) TaxID=745531 RepID=A0A0C3S525_PHLG1|nr:hypothetical protein PHLGIDRAFT_173174 [Phlebiopsis gigantea 11061_1 CR5-6]